MPVAIAGFLGSLSPVVSLHISLSVGGHCRVLWAAIAGFLGSLSPFCLPSSPFCHCLPSSPFIYPYPWVPGSVGGHCRVPGLPVSLCLPSSPFRNPYPWVAIAGFLGSLSPFVSLHLSLFAGGHCRVLWVSMKRRGASGLQITLSLSAGSKVGVVVVVVVVAVAVVVVVVVAVVVIVVVVVGSNRIKRSGI